MRGWSRLRPRQRYVVLGTVGIALLLVLVGAVVLERPHASLPGSLTGITADSPSVNTQTIKSCAAVTTCTTTAIALVAYSGLYVFVSALTGTAPLAISDSAAHTWGATIAHIAQSTTTEEYAYRVDNVSTAASDTVTVTFTASTTYTIGVLDIKNVATVSLDAAGAGSTGTSATTGSSAVTTVTTNDLVVLGISASASKTFAASGGDAVSQQTAAGGQLTEVDATTGAITLSTTWTTSASYSAVAVAVKGALVPSAPTSLAAGTITTTTVPLTWTNQHGPNVNNTVYQAAWASGACGAFSTKYSAGAASAYTVTGLTSRNAYCFQVSEWNSTGESPHSTSITNVQTANVPLAETGVTVTPVLGSTTSLEVKWSDAPGNTGIVNYTVYEHTATGCTGTLHTTNYGLGPLDFINNSLTANTAYWFTVQAWNATGGSAQSSCVSGTTYPVPSAPTGLGITATTATTVALAWTNPGGTLVNDSVYYGTSCGTWIAEVTTGGVASSYTVTGLNPFTSYCFEVAAWGAGAESALSTSQSVTTLTVPPGPPTGLTATGASTTSLSLTWTNPSTSSGALLNDTVYSGTSCSSLSTQTSTVASTQSFTLTGLTASTTYCLRVAAWTQAGVGTLSGFTNGTTFNAAPSAPTALTYVSASRTAITISWTQSAGTIVNDTVYWKAGTTCATGATGISASVATTYTVPALTAATQYCFVVTAWTNGGQSSQSVAVTGFTQGATPPAPQGAQSSTLGSTWANIEWTNPAGYTLFNNTVYWKQTTCGPAWTASLSTGGVVSSYNITGLTNGATYCVMVTAWDNESAYSHRIMFTLGNSSAGGGGGGGGGSTTPPIGPTPIVVGNVTPPTSFQWPPLFVTGSPLTLVIGTVFVVTGVGFVVVVGRGLPLIALSVVVAAFGIFTLLIWAGVL